MNQLIKIISGGQSGAEQAALDAAIKWQIQHGGWVPKGRKTDYRPLKNRYQMQEMPSDSISKCAERNIIEADGTLIMTHGKRTGSSEYAWETARKHARPYLHTDLNVTNHYGAARSVYFWVKKYHIETLNVVGPPSSKDPYIYQPVMKILVTVFHLDLIESTMPDPTRAVFLLPRTIDEAVDVLLADLPLRNRTAIAKLNDEALIYLRHFLGDYIRDKFGMEQDNSELVKSCCSFMEVEHLHAEEAASIIITHLWKKLKETHSLRIVN